MDPPLKRHRIPESHEQLHRKRARNDLRLKSRFESIFEKFGKDFNGVGDEIDLGTGEIVVNNGHLMTMQNEKDSRGLAIEEDELAVGPISTLEPLDRNQHEDVAMPPSQSMGREESSDMEVSCMGSNIAAAIKMEDGTCYDGSVHGELFITRNILNQLSHLGPHIQRSIANVRRSANTSKVVSIETEDLTVDPVWRVPGLVQPVSSPPLCEVSEKQLVDDHLSDSPPRSLSPPGQSLWSLDVLSSPPKTHRHQRWSREEDIKLQDIKTAVELRSFKPETHFPRRRASETRQRWQMLKASHVISPPSITSKAESLASDLTKGKGLSLLTLACGSTSFHASVPSSSLNTDSVANINGNPSDLLSSHDSLDLSDPESRRPAHPQAVHHEKYAKERTVLEKSRSLGSSRSVNLQGSSKNTRAIRTVQRRESRKTLGLSPPTAMSPPVRPSFDPAMVQHTEASAGSAILTTQETSKVMRRRRERGTGSASTKLVVSELMTEQRLSAASPRPPQIVGSQDRCQVTLAVEPVCPKRSRKVPDDSGSPSRPAGDSRATARPDIDSVLIESGLHLPNEADVQSCALKVVVGENEDTSTAKHKGTRYGKSRRTFIPSSPPGGPKNPFKDSTGSKQPSSKNKRRSLKYSDFAAKVVTPSRVHRIIHARDRSLSSSPDIVASSVKDLVGSSNSPCPVSRPQEAIAGKSYGRRSTLNKFRRKSISVGCDTALSLIPGDFSDDELSSVAATKRLSPSSSTFTKPISARQCGTLGVKCDRSLCLTCN